MLGDGIFLEKAPGHPPLLAPELDAAPLGIGGPALAFAHSRPLVEGQFAATAAKVLEPACIGGNAGEALAVGRGHVAQVEHVIGGDPGHRPERRARMHLVFGGGDQPATAAETSSQDDDRHNAHSPSPRSFALGLKRAQECAGAMAGPALLAGGAGTLPPHTWALPNSAIGA